MAKASLSSTPVITDPVLKSALEPYLINRHPKNNVPEGILNKLDKRLHLTKHHPLNIIKTKIVDYCAAHAKENKHPAFNVYDNLVPIVNTVNCFDKLRVGPEHVSRQVTDTYYLNEDTVLRTHTSAHQCEFIEQGVPAFLCVGDVYRRDEIDASHYPVFHQMEGVRIYENEEMNTALSTTNTPSSPDAIKKVIEEDLKRLLTGLARHLFGDVEMRWRDDFFPFTEPSFELDVFFKGEWMEVLGCGVIHHEVMQNAHMGHKHGWAFGLGLERLAMVLFDIPDIRLFWSDDVRFTSQFEDGKINKFVPYSKYPMCYKDVSFWLPKVEDQAFHQNDVYELIRDIAGDIVEKVALFDQFDNKKTGRTSHAYRIEYRHMDRSLTNEEVNEIQQKVRDQLESKLKVTFAK
eukprot:CAMPEP_0184969192 /NCGR_PEP_ID=MMETSP1098-20130426/2011_1 /TAXON_ID=89044 /ORGANISM="Spumella elongata, Strain CCAP 955/1" /LENGTH=403 /DNA_ID=CAMNT_0027490929 /DNA_START=166 /DNA_END=1375 /DNA_ORIENTATION=-